MTQQISFYFIFICQKHFSVIEVEACTKKLFYPISKVSLANDSKTLTLTIEMVDYLVCVLNYKHKKCF